MSAPGRGTRHAIEHRLVRVGRAFARALPERLATALGGGLGRFAASVARVRRADVDRHLALAFPERGRGWRDRTARACYAHFGREAAMLVRMQGWPPARVLERVELEGLDALHEAARAGPGAVLLAGHLGNWEVAGAAIVASGVPLDVVGKPMRNRSVDEDLRALRSSLGMGVIDVARAPREVLRALSGGKVVAMLGDQNAAEGGVFVPFFGREASTARGPALLALRAGVRVFLGIPLREQGRRQRYRVRFHELSVERSGDLDGDVRALLGTYARGLENAVRMAPSQYFWHHRRWKKRPREELSAGPTVTT